MERFPSVSLTLKKACILPMLALIAGIAAAVFSLAGQTPGNVAAQQPPGGPYTGDAASDIGAIGWHERGYDGLRPDGTTRVKVGIIDTGFFDFKTSADNGDLPTPPARNAYKNARVKTKCWERGASPGDWDPGPFSACDTRLYIDDVDNRHGTNVAEVIIDIAPEVELYISNAPDEDMERQAIQWMLNNEVDVINRSLGSSIFAPGDGTSWEDDDPIDNILLAVNHHSGPVFINSAGNEARGFWYGSYHLTGTNGYITMSNNGSDVNDITLETNEQIRIELRWDDYWGTGPGSTGAQCDLNIAVFKPRGQPDKTQTDQNVSFWDTPYESMRYSVIRPGVYSIGVQVGEHGCDAPNQPEWIQLKVDGSARGHLAWATRQGPLEGSGPGFYQMQVAQEALHPSRSAGGFIVAGAAENYRSDDLYITSSRGPTLDDRRTQRRPDLAALYCSGRTRANNGEKFCGTSSAAPAIAGAAALIAERFPNYNGRQIVNFLQTTAGDRHTRGFDTSFGYGVVALAGARLGTVVDDEKPGALTVGDSEEFILHTPSGLSPAVRVAVDREHLSLRNCGAPVTSLNFADAGELTIRACHATSTGDTAWVRLYKYATDEQYNEYRFTVADDPTTTPTFSCDSQEGTISGGKLVQGTWSASCPSLHVQGSYAHYHSFRTPNASRNFTFILNSAGVKAMFLIEGDQNGRLVEGTGSAPLVNTVVDRILLPNTDYTLEVVSVSRDTDPYTLTFRDSQPTPPPAPAAPEVRNCGPACMIASWTAGRGVGSYKVSWRQVTTAPASTYSVQVRSTFVGAALSTRATAGLSCGTAYHVWLEAVGDAADYQAVWSSISTKTVFSTPHCVVVTIPPEYSFTPLSNPSPGTPVGVVSASSVHGGVEYAITSGNTRNTFAIGSNTGEITLERRLDRGERSSYNLLVRATDRLLNTADSRVSVSVTGPPGLVSVPRPLAPIADDCGQECVKMSWTSGIGIDQYRVYWRQAGHTSSRHKVVDAAPVGMLQSTRLTAGLSCGTSYQVWMQAHGDGDEYAAGWSSSSAADLATTAACSMVEFPGAYDFSVEENVTVGTTIGTVAATSDEGAVSYSITEGNAGGVFAIGSSSGTITLALALDRDVAAAYQLTVRATDSRNNFGETPVTITVLRPALSDPSAPANLRRLSGSRSSLTVGWDAVEGASAYRLELYRGGQWSIRHSALIDTWFSVSGLSCSNSYRFRVSAYGDGSAYAEAWSVTSTELSARTSACPVPPRFSGGPYEFFVLEGAVMDAPVGTVRATDPDGPESSLRYSIYGGNDDENFAVNPVSGEISMAEDLGESAPDSFTLMVRVRDQQGLTASATVHIVVAPHVTVGVDPGWQMTGEGEDPYTVVVFLSEAPLREITVPLSIDPYQGASEADYSNIPESVVFGPQETEQAITVTIVDDDIQDPSEVVGIGFGDVLPAGVTVSTISAGYTMAYIRDNDGHPDAVVWSATLRAGEWDRTVGYRDVPGPRDYGRLSDYTFLVNPQGNVTVSELSFARDQWKIGIVRLVLDQELTGSRVDELTLHVGDQTFSFADRTAPSSLTSTWYGTVVPVMEAQEVVVKITLPIP